MSVVAATAKKFINDPADVVKESLTGLGLAHSDLLRVDEGSLSCELSGKCAYQSTFEYSSAAG